MANMLEYKCPNCGGAIQFDSHSQKVRCPFCDSEFDISEFEEIEKQKQKMEEKAAGKESVEWQPSEDPDWQDTEKGLRLFVCKSCGGEIVGDGNTAATSCPYCGNPVVMSDNLAGMLKPDFILPFKLDKKAAKEKLSEHVTGKKLLPKVFRDQNHIDEIKGIYVPFWLYDATTDADIEYLATRVRTWSDRDYDYTETDYFTVYRSGNMDFEKVPADGSRRMPDDLMDSIEPFDWEALTDFKMPYLAGYFADKYDVSAEDNLERVNGRIRQTTERAIRDSVHGFTTVDPTRSRIDIRRETAKYALLPVWLLTTTWNNETFLFAMNGQTGKFVGNLPVDKGASRRYFLLTFLITLLIVLVIGWLLVIR